MRAVAIAVLTVPLISPPTPSSRIGVAYGCSNGYVDVVNAVMSDDGITVICRAAPTCSFIAATVIRDP